MENPGFEARVDLVLIIVDAGLTFSQARTVQGMLLPLICFSETCSCSFMVFNVRVCDFIVPRVVVYI